MLSIRPTNKRSACTTMTRKTIGIRDLARHMDLAVSTVSRAMNARNDVSQETRTRVLQAARELGYTPNQSGRSLRQGATHTVALMMRTDIGRTAAGETFFMGLSDGLQRVLSGKGLDLVILPCGSDQDQDTYLARAVERRLADAFIISATRRRDPRIDYLIQRRVPFVALGRSQSGGKHAWIDLDFEGVAMQSVARLASRGHRRIALARTANDIYSNHLFAEAYRAAMTAHGLKIEPDLIISVPDSRSGGHELGQILATRRKLPTAVILEQETMAPGLYRRLATAGLHPGADLAVIGFRENRVCEMLTPSLTCFRVNLPAYGARVASLLSDRMVDGVAAQELWPMTLIPGESDGGP
jgi:DNA-binding LacI/PurR family transcriptional regulator